MKLRKLAGFGIATVAAASFAMVSTSAMAAAHHATSKNVKCTVVTKDKTVVVSVTKAVCDQLGGTVKTAANAKATKVSSAAPAQPSAQLTGAQTAAAGTATTQN